MICELCGRGSNSCSRVRVEGGVVIACPSCATLGEVVGPAVVKPMKPVQQRVVEKPRPAEFKVEVEFDLVDDYGGKIKSARERMSLKQEDLAKRVNETASFIHRVELGHAEPNMELAKKLQARLGVRLLVPHVEEELNVKSSGGKEITLGDIVVVKKKGGR